MEIPLRAKYRRGFKSRYKSPAATNTAKKKKSTQKRKTVQNHVRKLRVMTPSGRTYITDYDAYYG